jgi:hypothetical protein
MQMISGSSSEQIDAGYLWVEIELGCTLLHTAQISSDPEQIRKCHELAMSAYATVQRYLGTVALNTGDRRRITKTLNRLKQRLDQFTAPDPSEGDTGSI